eukprot:Blabericola_migrator_1__6957@NODE_3524_length_1708_cov_33_473492_g2189_i0_p1_GENE_NODE_3524_length_1708_cov_33_473492_g2189_i0NODE_3524_length_1708_cov_33_473492_g2189_i0_p1_ORF_typecomplete_len534_score82_35_NODE_3524_length_1708_cov_33_473492_g2189_i031604
MGRNPEETHPLLGGGKNKKTRHEPVKTSRALQMTRNLCWSCELIPRVLSMIFALGCLESAWTAGRDLRSEIRTLPENQNTWSDLSGNTRFGFTLDAFFVTMSCVTGLLCLVSGMCRLCQVIRGDSLWLSSPQFFAGLGFLIEFLVRPFAALPENGVLDTQYLKSLLKLQLIGVRKEVGPLLLTFACIAIANCVAAATPNEDGSGSCMLGTCGVSPPRDTHTRHKRHSSAGQRSQQPSLSGPPAPILKMSQTPPQAVSLPPRSDSVVSLNMGIQPAAVLGVAHTPPAHPTQQGLPPVYRTVPSNPYVTPRTTPISYQQLPPRAPVHQVVNIQPVARQVTQQSLLPPPPTHIPPSTPVVRHTTVPRGAVPLTQQRSVPVTQHRGVPVTQITQHRSVPVTQITQHRSVPVTQITQHRSVPVTQITQQQNTRPVSVTQQNTRPVSAAQVTHPATVPKPQSLLHPTYDPTNRHESAVRGVPVNKKTKLPMVSNTNIVRPQKAMFPQGAGGLRSSDSSDGTSNTSTTPFPSLPFFKNTF